MGRDGQHGGGHLWGQAALGQSQGNHRGPARLAHHRHVGACGHGRHWGGGEGAGGERDGEAWRGRPAGRGTGGWAPGAAPGLGARRRTAPQPLPSARTLAARRASPSPLLPLRQQPAAARQTRPGVSPALPRPATPPAPPPAALTGAGPSHTPPTCKGRPRDGHERPGPQLHELRRADGHIPNDGRPVGQQRQLAGRKERRHAGRAGRKHRACGRARGREPAPVSQAAPPGRALPQALDAETLARSWRLCTRKATERSGEPAPTHPAGPAA